MDIIFNSHVQVNITCNGDWSTDRAVHISAGLPENLVSQKLRSTLKQQTNNKMEEKWKKNQIKMIWSISFCTKDLLPQKSSLFFIAFVLATVSHRTNQMVFSFYHSCFFPQPQLATGFQKSTAQPNTTLVLDPTASWMAGCKDT